MPLIACRPKILTPAQAKLAMQRSLQINPRNADEARTVVRTPVGRRGGPRRLALLTAHRWPAEGVELSVQFMDIHSAELRRKILSHMNAWNRTANILFRETEGTGLVRITTVTEPPELAGHWSAVGTEILGIPEDQPTMNLQAFTLDVPDEEFHRVVRHEAGHTLGFEHEHMRTDLVKLIDEAKAIAFYDAYQGWPEEETRAQVLTPLAKESLTGTTESDPLSIMCYQIPGDITVDGKDIPGGTDINEKDYAFAASIYPKGATPPRPPQAAAPAMDGTATPARATVRDIPQLETAEQAAVRERQEALARSEADTFHLIIMDDFVPEKEPEEAAAGTPVPDKSSKPRKSKYARVFATYAGARVFGALQLRADEDEPAEKSKDKDKDGEKKGRSAVKKEKKITAFGRIIRTHERIKDYTNRAGGTLPTDPEMLDFGRDLFATLFQGDILRLYDEARARQHRRRLDLVLTSMIPWIAEKPWEFAYDASRRSFLATEDIHLIRNVLTGIPAQVIHPREGPLRILVAAAQPVGFGLLSAEQETGVIRRGFEPLIEAKLVEVEVIPRATPGRIHGRLSTQLFDVVHFIGHGDFDRDTQEGSLIFEDEDGGQYPLGERSVREIFCQRGVSLVFLNACQTGAGGMADFNKGVAQALVSHGLPALVANQYSVLDSSATSFAQHFYWALAQGKGIGEAAREARIAVNYSLQGESIDWAVPVVYARDPNMALCTKLEKVPPTPATAVRTSARQAIKTRPVRIALWDMEHSLAGLDKTVEKMNASQEVFGFNLVDLSSPLDVWDLETRADDGTPYLIAENLAERMARAAMELRVNILACITRHWLRDKETLNLYGWWPTEEDWPKGNKPPIVIFSCAGLALPPEGPGTDRAIANLAVTALVGFFTNMDSHEAGPEDCPMFFNPNRDLAVITGVQQFDSECRARLEEMIPDKVAALEALLQAFNPPADQGPAGSSSSRVSAPKARKTKAGKTPG